MDRLMSMRAFETVVTEGSFAAAARKLEVSPPVVTRLVADLEAHLGVRLLQRSTRRLVVTDAGGAYLERVRAILQEVDEAESATRSQSRQLEGIVRVHAPPDLATYVVSPLLSCFRRRFPRIRVDLEVDSVPDPLVEAYDVTLLGRSSDFDADLVARKIVQTKVFLVASPEYLKAHGVPQEPQDLNQHQALMLKTCTAGQYQWVLTREGHDDHKVMLRLEPGLSSNHSDTLVRAALDGAGITAVTCEMVACYLKEGTLVRVLNDWVCGQLAVYAILPSRRFVPQRTRVFLEHLVEETRRQADLATSLLGCCET